MDGATTRPVQRIERAAGRGPRTMGPGKSRREGQVGGEDGEGGEGEGETHAGTCIVAVVACAGEKRTPTLSRNPEYPDQETVSIARAGGVVGARKNDGNGEKTAPGGGGAVGEVMFDGD